MTPSELKKKIAQLATLVPKEFSGNELANVEHHLGLLTQAIGQAVDRADYREAKLAARETARLNADRKAKAASARQKTAEKERKLQKEIDRTAESMADVKIEE